MSTAAAQACQQHPSSKCDAAGLWPVCINPADCRVALPAQQVARRVRSADYIAKLSEQGRLQRHATRYMPACLAEEVFLHPRSCLASTAPEYVVYMSIVRTAKRPYMALVTSVEPQWLADSGSSLCTGELIYKLGGRACAPVCSRVQVPWSAFGSGCGSML